MFIICSYEIPCIISIPPSFSTILRETVGWMFCHAYRVVGVLGGTFTQKCSVFQRSKFVGKLYQPQPRTTADSRSLTYVSCFHVSFYDQNFIGRLVKLLDLVNISPNSDVTKRGVSQEAWTVYLYWRSHENTKKTQKILLLQKYSKVVTFVNFFLDVLGSLRVFLLTHTKVEGFLFQLRPPLRNTKNWVNLHQKIRQKWKTCRLPKAPVFRIPCCQ